MDEPVSQETGCPEAEFDRIQCGSCESVTRHKVLAECKSHYQDDSGQVDFWFDHQIVQCQGCLTVSFCEASRCSEEWDYDPDTGQQFLPATRKLFPNRIAGRPVMRDAYSLPHGVYKIYTEAHGAMCADLVILTGLGIRAIVEAVCNDKEIRGRDLAVRIDALAQNGLITEEGAAILHSLRFMGNAAAHEMRAHAPKELNAAFSVVEHLLQTVYILPRYAADLPNNGDN